MTAMTHLLLTGGTGFIGRRLCALARDRGMQVSVISRQPASRVKQLCGTSVNAIHSAADIQALPQIDHVINLAGEPILGGRWTPHRKQKLRDSRIEFTRQLINALANLPQRPDTFISGSAIGFYGNTGDPLCNEQSVAGNGFAASLCQDWERAAQPVTALKTRLCIVRIGVVLGPGGGSLDKMLLPFRMGLGGKVGDGQQWFSWIALDDLCNLLFFLLDHPECKGVFNGTAPEPVRNEGFTRQLAAALQRPAILPMPAFALKTLLGEAAGLLLDSQRVVPEAAQQAGFRFQYPDLEQALQAALVGS